MDRFLLRIMLSAMIFFGLTPISLAQVEPSCFAKASQKISPGKTITLIKQDGSKISGKLQSIDTLASVLHLYQVTQTDTETYAYQISDITKIKFKKPGKFRPEFSFLGLLVGGVVGGLIGNESGKSDPWFGGLDTAVGVVVGGGSGLLLGTVVGFSVNSTRTIECK